MNFRLCKKLCGMKQIELSSFLYDTGIDMSFIRMSMSGKRHSCVLTINESKFAKSFSHQMEKAIATGEATPVTGHDFDPACSLKRHTGLLDGIDMSKADTGFFDDNYVHGCRYCEMHLIDYGKGKHEKPDQGNLS